MDDFGDGIPKDRPFPHPQAVFSRKISKKKREMPEAQQLNILRNTTSTGANNNPKRFLSFHV